MTLSSNFLVREHYNLVSSFVYSTVYYLDYILLGVVINYSSLISLCPNSERMLGILILLVSQSENLVLVISLYLVNNCSRNVDNQIAPKV